MPIVPYARIAVRAGVLGFIVACSSFQPALSTRALPPSETISPERLKAWVTALASDSMLGRRAGTTGARRAEEFLASEAAQLGLIPAGEGGTFYQTVPLVRYSLDDSTTNLSVDGSALRLGDDYVPFPPTGIPRTINDAPVVFGGALGEQDSLSSNLFADKVVVVLSPPGSNSVPEFSSGPLSSAAAVVLVSDGPFHGIVSFLKRSATPYLKRPSAVPSRILATPEAATRLLGISVSNTLPIGTQGRTVSGVVALRQTALPSRNIVAILPGSDPRLRSESVVLGAHSDHNGVQSPVNHDSVRAFTWQAHRLAASSPDGRLTPEQVAEIRVNMDSLRAIRAPRLDSVSNGADDNASGSAALLAIAESMIRARVQPPRPIVFLWLTAEEIGLRGSSWFVENPTISLDSALAFINIDMVGRGGAEDITGGGGDYLQVIGSRQRSSALGDLIADLNRARTNPLRLDYGRDGWEHGSLPFCRSDHLPFAARGLPVAFFTTGQHPDYHGITDEAQYIDYVHMARSVHFIRDLTLSLASRAERLPLDRPVFDLNLSCRMSRP